MKLKNNLLKACFIIFISIITALVSVNSKFKTSIDGFFYDVSLASNFYLKAFFDSPTDDATQSASTIVVAIDEKTLSAPEAQSCAVRKAQA